MDAGPDTDSSKRSRSVRRSSRRPCAGCDGRFVLVESIPEGLIYPVGSFALPSTFSCWYEMLTRATSSIDIAAFYFNLTGGEGFPSGCQGQKIFDLLMCCGTKRNIKIRIAQNMPKPSNPCSDSDVLAKNNAAEVRSLDFKKLLGPGILHTKLIVVDNSHVYIGSANMDWRSLTQVKELGIYISDCPEVAEDVGKLFEVYWMMGAENATVPSQWPHHLSTCYNKENPINMAEKGLVYFSSCPPQFCPPGRMEDIDAVTSIIAKAKKFIYISVMDFVPMFVFQPKARYWGVIDHALRTAAIDHGAEVRLLVSWWCHSRQYMMSFLKSLAAVSHEWNHGEKVKVSVRLFRVPSTEEQNKLPHSRVNHTKYMVTDNSAYIGTSNWTADYFTSTGGVGCVVEGDTEIKRSLERVFLRDWDSDFAKDLS